jgi:hypothetical protein
LKYEEKRISFIDHAKKNRGMVFYHSNFVYGVHMVTLKKADDRGESAVTVYFSAFGEANHSPYSTIALGLIGTGDGTQPYLTFSAPLLAEFARLCRGLLTADS